jgi:hypothetical protein
MPNDVFHAADAVMVLAGDPQSPEGEAANQLIAQYELANAVGRLTNVTIMVTSEVRAFYEIGRRYPSRLTTGTLGVSGTAERGHMNVALVRLLLGAGADSSPPGDAAFVQPSFNLIATLEDRNRPGQTTKLTVYGVKLDRYEYVLDRHEVVMDRIGFQGLRVAVEET